MTKLELKRKILKVLKVFNGREEAIFDICWKELAEIKKENTKLKTDYEVLSCSVGDFGELQNKLEEEQRKNNGLSDNLTKAKELIKRLMHELVVSDRPYDEVDLLVKDVEQFLREIDIDNAIQKANEGLDLDKIAGEIEQDLNESCPDVLCKDCNKEDCISRKLGLIC